MSDLAAHVQSLPMELYDEIYKLVFTASTAHRFMTSTYKFPSELQVSRAFRKKFATTYFGGMFRFNDLGTLRNWLMSVAKDHRTLVKQIDYSGQHFGKTFDMPLHPYNMFDQIANMLVNDKCVQLGVSRMGTEYDESEFFDRDEVFNEIVREAPFRDSYDDWNTWHEEGGMYDDV